MDEFAERLSLVSLISCALGIKTNHLTTIITYCTRKEKPFCKKIRYKNKSFPNALKL